MNDRLKYRIWWESRQKYIDDRMLITPTGRKLWSGMTIPVLPSEDDDYIVEQCTGLKDKNGNLIYEGDLIKDRGEIKYQIMWKNARFVAVAIKEFDYMPDTLLNQKWLDTWKIEIIGNIHEQAEQKG